MLGGGRSAFHKYRRLSSFSDLVPSQQPPLLVSYRPLSIAVRYGDRRLDEPSSLPTSNVFPSPHTPIGSGPPEQPIHISPPERQKPVKCRCRPEYRGERHTRIKFIWLKVNICAISYISPSQKKPLRTSPNSPMDPRPTLPCLGGCLADDVNRPAQGLPPHSCCT